MQGEAATIAALFAVDPVGLGGVALRAPAGALRDDWLALLRALLPAGTPLRRVPLNCSDTALLGGLDLGATLQRGRPVVSQGLLAQADGGVLLLAMAERMGGAAAARFCAALDTQNVQLQRDGLSAHHPARLGLVALDEGIGDDEQMPRALQDRMAFRLVLDSDAPDEDGPDWSAPEVVAARLRLPQVVLDDLGLRALCAAAQALGIDSLRAPLLAARVARAAAALAGCDAVEEEHIAVAARLVLAPRATRLPPPVPTEADAEPQDAPADTESPEPPVPDDPATPPNPPPADQDAPPAPDAPGDDDHEPPPAAGETLDERVLEAASAALPAGLLASLKISQLARTKTPSAGSAGVAQNSALRGRPIGARKGEPRAGQRLNVLETLRAAAPWQKLRQAAAHVPQGVVANASSAAPASRRIQVRKEDFHVARFRQLGQTTTVFVVDASGSAALNRLAEAKGAVELLLADCYVRRDSVAVLAFRGKAAELLLPPTRSLARAKRSLAALPGGGGTPLASAMDAALALAEQIRRKGETPILVLLTDGRGNIARDGTPGRQQAAQDSLNAAAALRGARVTALLVDTSAQPHPAAQQLALAMGARYLALPYAGAQAVSQAVRAVSGR
ncbi:MAG: magnesium chelatase subunit D [Rhodoferax sp.]|nr:magnesium chelatase subunit D [Rhodoferax sp.]